MAGIDNLTPYTGQDGSNPNPTGGRPKGVKNRSTILREIYEMVINREDLDGLPKPMQVEAAIMKALIIKALAGDVPAIKEAQDSVYGKVSDKVEHTGKDGEKLDGLNVTFVGGKKDGQ